MDRDPTSQLSSKTLMLPDILLLNKKSLPFKTQNKPPANQTQNPKPSHQKLQPKEELPKNPTPQNASSAKRSQYKENSGPNLSGPTSENSKSIPSKNPSNSSRSYPKGSKNPLKDNALLLGFTSFLNDVGSEMIAPWIPLFITLLGGGPEIIGLINGIHTGFHNLIIYPSGYLSDKLKKRKLFLYSGYTTSAISKFLMALSINPLMVTLISILDRIGKGIRSAPRDVILSSYHTKERGRAFGIQMSLDKAGAFTGALLGILLVSVLKIDLRITFALAGIISLLSIIPIKYVKVKPIQNNKPNSKLNLTFMLIALFYSLMMLGYMFFLMKLEPFGALITGGAYLFFNLANTLGPILSGKLVDSNRRNLLWGLSLLSLLISNLAYLLTNSPILLILGISLFGLGGAMLNIALRTFVSLHLSENKAGRSFGLFNTIIGVGIILTNTIGGLLWKLFGAEGTFTYGVLTIVVFTITLIIYRKNL